MCFKMRNSDVYMHRAIHKFVHLKILKKITDRSTEAQFASFQAFQEISLFFFLLLQEKSSQIFFHWRAPRKHRRILFIYGSRDSIIQEEFYSAKKSLCEKTKECAVTPTFMKNKHILICCSSHPYFEKIKTDLCICNSVKVSVNENRQ